MSSKFLSDSNYLKVAKNCVFRKTLKQVKTFNVVLYIDIIFTVAPQHSEESLFPNKHLCPLLLIFWLKWAGYLAVAGLNLLAQISDRISPFGV